MSQTSENNKRIAKNTLLLYVRMVFLMLVTLYSSRVILKALGVEDYGIYNVVGGIVTMFQMLSGSLSAAITRFITFELGRGDCVKLRAIFSTAINIQLFLGLVIIVLAETVGLWFLECKMVIPENRLVAAIWVYQFSILTFLINLISVPYNSEIIAHECMDAFAYIGIFDALGRLAVAFLIAYAPFDRLIYYSVLMCVLALILRFIYWLYCKRKFEECKYECTWDSKLLKEMFSFAGWNFIGSSSAILREHGGAILINLFFGPTVNAAKGIATQVNSAVTAFTNNFLTAVQPQITKSYASGERKYMMSLLFKSIRLSFYMLLVLTLPIFTETSNILNLWLGSVPNYSIAFVQLTLVFTLSEAVSHPLVTAMLATGKIRNYQLVVGGIQMLNLPLSYLCLYLGMDAQFVLVVSIILSQCCLFARLMMLRNMIGLSVWGFLRQVYMNIFVVTLVAVPIPILLSLLLDDSFPSMLFLVLASVLCASFSTFFFGCEKSERNFILEKVRSLLSRKQ